MLRIACYKCSYKQHVVCSHCVRLFVKERLVRMKRKNEQTIFNEHAIFIDCPGPEHLVAWRLMGMSLK